MSSTAQDIAMRIIREAGMVRLRELKKHGVHAEVVRRLLANGMIIRVGRGLYSAAEAEPSSLHSYAQVAHRVPHGVICLLSALRFHEIGTQSPHEVWLAIDRRARKPGFEKPRLHIVRFSDRALSEGIEQHTIEGATMRVYNPAKTVSDCFKYRNKIGIDVAIESLREGLRGSHFTREELWYYAKVCRITNVIRPYMEALS